MLDLIFYSQPYPNLVSVAGFLGYDVLGFLSCLCQHLSKVSVAGFLGYDVLVLLKGTVMLLSSFSCWLFRL